MASSGDKQKRKRIFTGWELFFMAVPLAGVASLHITKAPLFWGIYATGRADGCSLERSLDVERQLSGISDLAQQFNAKSKIEEQDAQQLNRWSTPWGTFWAPKETSVPFLLAEQAKRVYGDGKRRVQPGDIVLDCGANVGTFTREALMAGAGKVVSIEPSEQNVECLRRNFAKEIEEGRVVVYPKGVWHREEVLELKVYDNSALDTFVMSQRVETDSKPRIVKLPVTTIDKLVAELRLPRVDFIKMDIEGAERQALRGAAGTIRDLQPRLAIATENLPDDAEVVPQVMKEVAPGYQSECGPCALLSMTRIRPDIYYFFPR